MSIDLSQRLSITLTRSSLVIVLALGAVLAAIQVYLDYIDQEHAIESRIEQIIEVSAIPAQRAVHHLDNELAQEVVLGLTKYKFLHHISIFDDRNEIMAIYDTPITNSGTMWLTRYLKGFSSTYEHPLQNITENYQGKLILKLNNDMALAPIYKRGLYIFFSGLARNLLLAVILAYLYHRLLTRPLFNIARNFDKLNKEHDPGARLPQIPRHEHNELGHIVDSANSLLEALELREKDNEQSEKQLRIILNASPNQVYALNTKGEFVFLNTATANFYKNTIANLEGKNFFEIHQKINENEAYEFLKHIKKAEAKKSGPYELEHSVTDGEGVKHIVNVSLIPYTLYNQKCTLVISSDVTARVEAENRVEKLSNFDTLTHLPNKHQIQDRLKDDIRISRKRQFYGALLFIDIDNFKRVNDTLGHSTGDALLLKVSNRLQTQIRKTETLARLGGDDFILSVPSVSAQKEKTKNIVSALAERILDSVRQPIHLGTHEFEITASIGIAIYPDGEQSLEKILSAADTAMYKAKVQGQDRYVFFESSMSDEASRIVKLESDIRRAIAEDQFSFHLQPQLDSTTKELVGAEALMRWDHPEKGEIHPTEFISFLENTPMMGKVGEIILDKVCAFIYSCRNRNVMGPELRIAVNISAREFYQPHFIELVQTCLKKYHLHGTSLEFEVTENTVLQQIDKAIDTMLQLKELGIHLALDDFGTGYSSLSYLKQLPVDKIKIDQSFIKDIAIDQQDAMLVASIIAIANTLNLEVVAEGVETEDQAAWLNFHGEVRFQGYLFERPLPKHEFESHYLDENPTLALPIQ